MACVVYCGASIWVACASGCAGTCSNDCGTCGAACGDCTGSCFYAAAYCSGNCGSGCQSSCSGTCATKCTDSCNNGCTGGAYTDTYSNFNWDILIKYSDLENFTAFVNNECTRRTITPVDTLAESQGNKIFATTILDLYNNIYNCNDTTVNSSITSPPSIGTIALKTLMEDYLAQTKKLYEKVIPAT